MKTPKSKFVRVGATLLALTVVPFTFAQSEKPAGDKPAEKAPGDKGGPRGGGQRGDQLKMMTERLKLTDEQVAKIKPIVEAQGAEMAKLRDVPREERREKMKAVTDATDAKLTPILTADQVKELKAWRAEMANRMREGGGQRQGGRPPREGGDDKAGKPDAPKD